MLSEVEEVEMVLEVLEVVDRVLEVLVLEDVVDVDSTYQTELALISINTEQNLIFLTELEVDVTVDEVPDVVAVAPPIADVIFERILAVSELVVAVVAAAAEVEVEVAAVVAA